MSLSNLQNIIDTLRTIDVEAETLRIVEDNTKRVTELMQVQLSEGVDIDGDKRSDQYRPLTIYLKQKNGQGLGRVTDRVTFFMQGNLYNSLQTVIAGSSFYFASPLPTFDKMVDRVGQQNFGLGPFGRADFVEEVTIPGIKKYLQTKGLSFL